MAKKILAVVMAVMIAVSAMAISVSAETIDLFDPNYRYQDKTIGTYEVSFDIPVYGLYGYLTAGDYMRLTLPAWWGWNINDDVVDWNAYVNGEEYHMKAVKTAGSGDTDDQILVLAYLPHHYNSNDNNTAIPQAINWNQIYNIRLVATVQNNGAADAWRMDTAGLFTNNNATYRGKAKAQWYKADGSEVPGSVSYIESWNPQASNGSSVNPGLYDFVTDEWVVSTKDSHINPLTWDHTLLNRATLAAAESVKLVVETNKPINGQATYTLYANRDYSNYDTNYQNLWWQYSSSRQYVSQCPVTEATTKLEFDVPLNIIFENNYGTMNREFVIFENITLYNQGLMPVAADGTVDYMHVSTAANKGGTSGGTYGRLSWNPAYGGEATMPLLYDGQPVNYARSGKAGVGHVDGYVKYDATKAVASGELSVPVGAAGWSNNVGFWNESFDALKDDDVVAFYNIPAGLTVSIQGANGDAVSGNLEGFNKLGDNSIQVTGKWIKDLRNNAWIQLRMADAVNTAFNMNWAIFAKGAVADMGQTNYTGYQLGADVMATKIYLETTSADEDDAVEPEAPTQDTVTDDEPEKAGDDVPNVDVEPEETTPAPAPDTTTPAPAPAEDNNPKTGVALAVLPMLLSAAAAVVSKKH